ncbi:MAG TPA: T9SS type A sorting domain-containing protein [Anditalea sp.]|nr:T9SS type A sorting domain-containing protein [Anditalea sp.]
MNSFLLVLIACALLCLSVSTVKGQTFTSNGSCTPMDVNNLTCWDITGQCAAGNNTLPFSNLVKGAGGCEVNIVLNHPVTYNGDLTFGGSFNTLKIVGNGRLTVIGDLIVDGSEEVNVFLENGGELEILGELKLSLGSTNSNTVLNIDGDSSSFVTTSKIDLRGRAQLNIKPNGGLIAHGETRYNGNSSEINVEGVFLTGAITIQGGRNHKLNAIGQGKIGVLGNVTLAGDAQISFGGSSEVEIAGELSVSGNAVLEIKETASVKVCQGTLPEVEGESYDENSNQTGVFVDVPSNYEKSCDFFILPVEYVYVEAELNVNELTANISWATSKEWENSHFEIERSDKGIEDFITIGEVAGMGWSDMIVDYSFEDTELPFRSGPVYYRLKQMDFNGNYSYSKTVMVRVPEMQATKGNWRAYPNPVAGDVLKITSLNPSELKTNIQVKIISSQSLMSQFIVSNEIELNDQVMGAFGRIPQGLFVIELQWNNQVEYLKILKR